MRNAQCIMRNAECGMRNAECGMHVPQAYCTDDVSSLFNSLNTPYRCGTNTVEDGIKNISSILSKTVLTLYKIRV